MPLTAQQLDDLQGKLAARRHVLAQELRAEMAQQRERSPEDLAGLAPDSGDQSVADLLTHLGTAEAARDVTELREIEAAIARIAEGDYGECIDCGQEIAARRLAALPTARRCVQCQSRHEKIFAQPDRPRL
jgi:RNA polymerase-binding protein DksA